MPESEGSPRRAWLSDADTSSPPDTDPTPADDIFRPRRGSTDDAAAFSRPDSDEPQGETPIPAPVFPRSAGEVADSPSPAPRRSALSSSTPLEAETPAPPPRTQPARPGLAVWALGGLVGALAVGMIAFYASRGAEPATSQSASPSGSAAASASASPTVVAAPEDLVTGEDLAGIAAAASWSVTHTSSAAADHEGRVACLSTQTEDQNPTSSLQRTLATSDEDQLAALHRIETYASPAAAQQVFANRSTALASCDEIPARIVRATSVEGMGDEAFQISVVFEDVPIQYHTLLMTRVGSAIQLLDVARTSSPVEAQLAADALARPQGTLCTIEAATCAPEPTITDAVVPAAEPVGWLIPSDLPRIRPGSGRWTASDPTDLTSAGMGCENLTLVSEPGPTERRQATYLMTQDDQAPDTFGVDELRFTFPDAAGATAFATKLGNAIASCKDRVNTATVSELPAVTGTGEAGLPVSSRLFSVTQATADDKGVPYRLVVSVAGEHVSYTIITVTAAYSFTDAQLTELALRIPVRASQG
ncbi:hypothetical protein H5399_15930 [Tessaracoccus sp. MC1627]|uniref:hypothetical protein n=1 Tax=Tessaracoccus sp. MC1627 TaxID=2760312 RepID=UPI0016033258|nr:hypothetical protein [Tessaracoccus sp. MC1627]MBB1514077.1 hypothetical protein [Tessaracoccus sp. MC1627]